MCDVCHAVALKRNFISSSGMINCNYLIRLICTSNDDAAITDKDSKMVGGELCDNRHCDVSVGTGKMTGCLDIHNGAVIKDCFM